VVFGFRSTSEKQLWLILQLRIGGIEASGGNEDFVAIYPNEKSVRLPQNNPPDFASLRELLCQTFATDSRQRAIEQKGGLSIWREASCSALLL
jgi:hypothetical protein